MGSRDDEQDGAWAGLSDGGAVPARAAQALCRILQTVDPIAATFGRLRRRLETELGEPVARDWLKAALAANTTAACDYTQTRMDRDFHVITAFYADAHKRQRRRAEREPCSPTSSGRSTMSVATGFLPQQQNKSEEEQPPPEQAFARPGCAADRRQLAKAGATPRVTRDQLHRALARLRKRRGTLDAVCGSLVQLGEPVLTEMQDHELRSAAKLVLVTERADGRVKRKDGVYRQCQRSATSGTEDLAE